MRHLKLRLEDGDGDGGNEERDRSEPKESHTDILLFDFDVPKQSEIQKLRVK